MKKLIAVMALMCLLTIPAFAVDWEDFAYYENGIKVIDVDSYNAAVAAELVAAAGLNLDVNSFWYFTDTGVAFDNASFETAYLNALAELEEQAEVVLDDPVDNSSSVDDTGYPVGSYIDESGNVYSSDGDLLSSGDSSVMADDPVLSDETLVPDDNNISVIIEDNSLPPVYAVSDMRGLTYALNVVDGLKALIVSIFGEYEPVLTTIAVTETVDNVTTTTLIDAVASGAAGVDYEWLAGVFLFGILLYCLMKLLGGIIK